MPLAKALSKVVLALLAACPAASFAETAYVTDSLRLGLHRAEDTSDAAFRTLESGQELEILTRNRNYAHVRLPDGTTGHVKAAYLVTEKPAALVVAETRQEQERLREALEQARRQFAEPAATIAALEQAVAGQRAELTRATERLQDLEAENSLYAERQAAYRYSLPLGWVAGALGVVLLCGFIGGMWWLDFRIRRRHGGLRIY